MKQELLMKVLEMLISSDDKEDKTKPNSGPRAIVAFANNCIIFGYSDATKLGDITMQQARYCYYYAKRKDSEEKGFMALAKYGPADGSKVSGPVDNVTVDACCIIDATKQAVSVWESSKWES